MNQQIRTSLETQRSTDTQNEEEQNKRCESSGRRGVSGVIDSTNDNQKNSRSKELWPKSAWLDPDKPKKPKSLPRRKSMRHSSCSPPGEAEWLSKSEIEGLQSRYSRHTLKIDSLCLEPCGHVYHPQRGRSHGCSWRKLYRRRRGHPSLARKCMRGPCATGSLGTLQMRWSLRG